VTPDEVFKLVVVGLNGRCQLVIHRFDIDTSKKKVGGQKYTWMRRLKYSDKIDKKSFKLHPSITSFVPKPGASARQRILNSRADFQDGLHKSGFINCGSGLLVPFDDDR
jgi:hypothetical protein